MLFAENNCLNSGIIWLVADWSKSLLAKTWQCFLTEKLSLMIPNKMCKLLKLCSFRNRPDPLERLGVLFGGLGLWRRLEVLGLPVEWGLGYMIPMPDRWYRNAIRCVMNLVSCNWSLTVIRADNYVRKTRLQIYWIILKWLSAWNRFSNLLQLHYGACGK